MLSKIIVDDVPETVDHLIRNVCTMVFAAFIFCEGSGAINEVCCQLHRAEEIVHLSRWHRESSVQCHLILLSPSRQDPTASLPV